MSNFSDFNSPEFLKVAIKYGLLSPSADAFTMYELHGQLLRDEEIRKRRIAGVLVPRKIEAVIEAMSPAELQALRERVLGVLPFRSKK